MDNLQQTLQGINWNFSDYNSAKYPLDINSIPWYPATFIPPIPKFLIALLTKSGDTVLDPFGGKGTTAIETIKQNRFPLYNDLNPFAAEITTALLYAIKSHINGNTFPDDEEAYLGECIVPIESEEAFISRCGISNDVFKWYDANTLTEIFSIVNLMYLDQENNTELFYVRKLALSSILKQASSQPGHFTYITDNCKPAKLIYKNAKKLYVNKMVQIKLAAQDMIKQFSLTNPDGSLSTVLDEAKIVTGDARNMGWINSLSVNLVITSPPYLCAQDYIKTMRLTNLFFPDQEGFDITPKKEIGPRNKRRSKAELVIPNYYSDMDRVFSEIERVLVPKGFFCLIIGQGKSKITAEYDTISDLCDIIKQKHRLNEIYHVTRKIGNRVIQVGGVDTEDIIVFQKTN